MKHFIDVTRSDGVPMAINITKIAAVSPCQNPEASHYQGGANILLENGLTYMIREGYDDVRALIQQKHQTAHI